MTPPAEKMGSVMIAATGATVSASRTWREPDRQARLQSGKVCEIGQRRQ